MYAQPETSALVGCWPESGTLAGVPLCPYGAQVRPGAPATFRFEETEILSALEDLHIGPLSWAAAGIAATLGLPIGDVDTAAFVAVEPPDDQPTAEDWAKLAFPPVALLSGTYGRIGNYIRLQKWAELAVCNGSPPSDYADWTTWATITCTPPHGPGIAVGATPKAPPGAQFRFKVLSRTTPDEVTFLAIDFVTVPVLTNFPYTTPEFPSGIHYGHTFTFQEWNEAHPADQFGIDVGVRAVLWTDPNWYREDLAETVLVQIRVPVVAPHDPEVPILEQPHCPPTPDAAAVGEYLCQLESKIDRIASTVEWLASIALPPTATADDAPVEVPPEGTLDKPANAVGAVVEITTPITVARYGRNPGFIGSAGHASIGTPDGWLPSVPLKHEKQMLWPLPPHATVIGLDLRPGITGTVRWLRAPK